MQPLQDNLTGDQIVSIMEDLILKAIGPLACQTNYIHGCLIDALKPAMTDHRRKLCTAYDTHEDMAEAIFRACASAIGSDEVRIAALADLHLDRTVWARIFNAVETVFGPYRDLETRALKGDSTAEPDISRIHKAIFANRPGSLGSAIAAYQEYESIYREFCGLIIDKYRRYIHMAASRHIHTTAREIARDDLIHNLTLGLGEALRKYNPTKGAMQTYVLQWMTHAITSPDFSHTVSEAYGVTGAERRKISEEHAAGIGTTVTFAESLESPGAQNCESEDRPEEKITQEDYRNKFGERIFNLGLEVKIYLMLLDTDYSLSENDLLMISPRNNHARSRLPPSNQGHVIFPAVVRLLPDGEILSV